MAENDYMFVTGRIVSGHPTTKQPDRTDPQTGVVKEGGWFVGIAVLKTDPAGSQVKEAVMAVAKTAWPGGEWDYPNFSSKIRDGDLPPQNSKEGYPGHWIFGFAQSWPFQIYETGGSVQIVDPKAVKKGDYARVPFTVRGNDAKVQQNQTPGVYLNAALIEFLGYGKAIMTGPDPTTVMRAIGAAVMPAGASAAPVATGPPMTPGNLGGQTNAAPLPTVGVAPGVPNSGVGIQPAPNFLNPPIMLAKAGGVTYQQFIDQGWTKEALITEGYMAAF